ncbi:putative methyltransferase [Trichoplax sp. H2]|nr:putative methyltransferase [Trichoplax sp. H2]|eukprot:RDD41850.1 putative methyltransferase [Trichoplax sp. H2]
MTEPTQTYHLYDKTWISQNYDQFRPSYPTSLIQRVMDYLSQGASQQDKFDLAIDVGCGSGISTKQYAPYFNRVIGTDHSATQLDQARQENQHPNVTFQVSAAETLPFEDNTVDLVVCAQAIHWFNMDQFFAEVNRVLKPNTGCVALYAYSIPVIMNCDEAQQLNHHIYFDLFDVPEYKSAHYFTKCCYKNIEWPFSQTIRDNSIIVDSPLDVEAYVNLLHTYSDNVNVDLPYPDPELKIRLAKMLKESTGAEILQHRYTYYYMLGRKPSKI